MIITSKRVFNKEFFDASEGSLPEELINGRNHFYSSTARGGLEGCMKSLGLDKNSIVLIPAYSPQGVVQPFIKSQIKYHFYKLTDSLLPDISDITDFLGKYNISAIVIIHYFGYAQPIEPIIRIIKQRKILVIEDCAQGFLSKDRKGKYLGYLGDIAFFSFPKYIPLVDGALFISNNPNIKFGDIVYRKFSILNSLALSFHYLYLILKKIQFNTSYSVLSKVAGLLCLPAYYLYYECVCLSKNPNKLSGFSKRMLKKFNYLKFIDRRGANIKYIYNNLSAGKFKILLNGYDDLLVSGIPILVENRKEFIKTLKKSKVEVTTYSRQWFLINQSEKGRFQIENNLYTKLCLLPVSENLSIEKVQRLVSILNSMPEWGKDS